jgi:uncharacterized phiE125 gp8 family phage protein
MALVYRSGPAVEPLSLSEAKAHLRLETTADDALVTSLIITSRLHIEAALGLALTAQDWTLVLDAWPATGVVNIPMRPVSAVTAVRVRASDGTSSVVPPASYVFEGAGLPPRLVPVSGALPNPGRAAGGIEIDFTAGYGAAAASVPEPIRQALKLLVAHWYEHRDPVEIGDLETAIPAAVTALVKPYAVPRL